MNLYKNTKSSISRGAVANKDIKRVKNVTTLPKDDKRYISNGKKPKYEYGKVNEIWTGETVYLIGGGPSLKNFEWNSLHGKKVLFRRRHTTNCKINILSMH